MSKPIRICCSNPLKIIVTIFVQYIFLKKIASALAGLAKTSLRGHEVPVAIQILKNCTVQRVTILITLTTAIYAKNNTTITFSGALGLEHLGQTQSVLMTNVPTVFYNRYVANNDNHSYVAPQLFVGKSFWQYKQTDVQLGLTLGYINNLAVNGVVEQFALPEFDNLNYHYNIRNTRILATVNAITPIYSLWSTYINLGAGLAQNRSGNYHETPRIFGAEPMSPFTNNSILSFTYHIGAGMVSVLNDMVSINLGYQFVSLGRAKLGVSLAQSSSSESISLSQIYLNQFLVGINIMI